MAIEDSVVLAECLSRVRMMDDIPILLGLYERLRMERVHIITAGARETADVWHLPDGAEQELRDASLKNTVKRSDLQTDRNANKYSDPSFQPWLFGFDAVADVRKPPQSHFLARILTTDLG